MWEGYCPHCGQKFSVPEKRDNHAKTCDRRPKIEVAVEDLEKLDPFTPIVVVLIGQHRPVRYLGIEKDCGWLIFAFEMDDEGVGFNSGVFSLDQIESVYLQ